MHNSDTRIREVVEFSELHGEEKAMEVFNVKHSTLDRYRQEYKKRFVDEAEEMQASTLLKRLSEKFTDKELRAILNSSDIDGTGEDEQTINFEGHEVTLGIMSDLHIGSKYTHTRDIFTAYKEFEKAGVDYIMMPGDITEGMSNRPGHIYELSDIGYHEQKKKAIVLMNEAPCPIYAIDGNHDRWFIKSNGAKIVSDIADAVEHFHFCGHDNATLRIRDCKIMLWHGEDGASYASSYRPQKIIESIAGGKKPNVILAGHDHKALYLFDRNIHFISSGTMQGQTAWMRGKRLVAYVGFWIVKIVIDQGEVKKITPTWYPFYK
jgi:predicted phosphodiesterase